MDIKPCIVDRIYGCREAEPSRRACKARRLPRRKFNWKLGRQKVRENAKCKQKLSRSPIAVTERGHRAESTVEFMMILIECFWAASSCLSHPKNALALSTRPVNRPIRRVKAVQSVFNHEMCALSDVWRFEIAFRLSACVGFPPFSSQAPFH